MNRKLTFYDHRWKLISTWNSFLMSVSPHYLCKNLNWPFGSTLPYQIAHMVPVGVYGTVNEIWQKSPNFKYFKFIKLVKRRTIEIIFEEKIGRRLLVRKCQISKTNAYRVTWKSYLSNDFCQVSLTVPYSIGPVAIQQDLMVTQIKKIVL